MKNQEIKKSLEIKLNYLYHPGAHTTQSPVSGSRATELAELRQALTLYPTLQEFEKAIYRSENIYIIPTQQREKAHEVSHQFFLDYIKKYEMYGVSEENAVDWCLQDDIYTNKTWIFDLEDAKNTWKIVSVVRKYDDSCNEKFSCFLPPYIVALHELMHVEEIPKKISKLDWELNKSGHEIITTVKTIILLDEVYKKINDIDIDTIVDYKKNVEISGKTISIGSLANFYRNLEKAKTNLMLAIISPESLKFLEAPSVLKIEEAEEKLTLKSSPKIVTADKDEKKPITSKDFDIHDNVRIALDENLISLEQLIQLSDSQLALITDTDDENIIKLKVEILLDHRSGEDIFIEYSSKIKFLKKELARDILNIIIPEKKPHLTSQIILKIIEEIGKPNATNETALIKQKQSCEFIIEALSPHISPETALEIAESLLDHRNSISYRYIYKERTLYNLREWCSRPTYGYSKTSERIMTRLKEKIFQLSTDSTRSFSEDFVTRYARIATQPTTTWNSIFSSSLHNYPNITAKQGPRL
jgi:hypothetical protein